MAKYILHRLLIMIPTLLGISLIVFSIMTIIPGDPGTLLLGDKATVEQKQMLNDQLGYNRPFTEKYAAFLKDVLHGDLGNSYRTRQPVMDEIMIRFPKTLKLAVLSLSPSMPDYYGCQVRRRLFRHLSITGGCSSEHTPRQRTGITAGFIKRPDSVT